MILLGSHISLNKPNKYLLGVVKESIENGATTFMIFTGAPHNKIRIPISNMFLNEARELGKAHDIFFSNAVVHAPYIINLANPNSDNATFGVDVLVKEIQRTHEMGIKYVVLHPGFHVGQTLEEGIKRLIENLKLVLQKIESLDVTLCLETMSNKKNQIGGKLEHLRALIKGCDNHPKLGLCLDTVHMHDAGYDLRDRDKLFKEIDDLIGFERVKVLHLGDSAHPRGSTKDIHANFNYGHIGFDCLLEWAYDERFKGMPIIIETPFWLDNEEGIPKKSFSPYKHEIKMIKNKSFEPIPEQYYPRNFKTLKDKNN